MAIRIDCDYNMACNNYKSSCCGCCSHNWDLEFDDETELEDCLEMGDEESFLN